MAQWRNGTCVVAVDHKNYEVEAQSKAEASVEPLTRGEQVTVAGRTGRIQIDQLTKALVVPISQRLAGHATDGYPDDAKDQIRNTLRVSSTDSAPSADEQRSDMLTIARGVLVTATQPGPAIPPTTDKRGHIALSPIAAQPVFGLPEPLAAQDMPPSTTTVRFPSGSATTPTTTSSCRRCRPTPNRCDRSPMRSRHRWSAADRSAPGSLAGRGSRVVACGAWSRSCR